MDTVEVTFKETDLSASPEEQHKDHVTVFRGTVNLVHLHPRGDLSGQTGYKNGIHDTRTENTVQHE